MSKIADTEANATSLDGLVNDNGLIPTLRNGPKPSYQYLVDEMQKSRGFRVVGTFADGFTYELFNDVGIDADGNSWIYVGAGAPNKVVSAGTVPSAPDYEQVTFGVAENVALDNGENLQQAIDRLNAEIDDLDASAIATDSGASVQEYINENPTPFKTVADMKSAAYLSTLPEFTRVEWQGYYAQSDGGGNWGVLRFGSHSEDGGSIFSLDSNTYIKANIPGNKVNILKFGGKAESGYDNKPHILSALECNEVNSIKFTSGVFESNNFEITRSDIKLYAAKGANSTLKSMVSGERFIKIGVYDTDIDYRYDNLPKYPSVDYWFEDFYNPATPERPRYSNISIEGLNVEAGHGYNSVIFCGRVNNVTFRDVNMQWDGEPLVYGSIEGAYTKSMTVERVNHDFNRNMRRGIVSYWSYGTEVKNCAVVGLETSTLPVFPIEFKHCVNSKVHNCDVEGGFRALSIGAGSRGISIRNFKGRNSYYGLAIRASQEYDYSDNINVENIELTGMVTCLLLSRVSSLKVNNFKLEGEIAIYCQNDNYMTGSDLNAGEFSPSINSGIRVFDGNYDTEETISGTAYPTHTRYFETRVYPILSGAVFTNGYCKISEKLFRVYDSVQDNYVENNLFNRWEFQREVGINEGYRNIFGSDVDSVYAGSVKDVVMMDVEVDTEQGESAGIIFDSFGSEGSILNNLTIERLGFRKPNFSCTNFMKFKGGEGVKIKDSDLNIESSSDLLYLDNPMGFTVEDCHIRIDDREIPVVSNTLNKLKMRFSNITIEYTTAHTTNRFITTYIPTSNRDDVWDGCSLKMVDVSVIGESSPVLVAHSTSTPQPYVQNENTAFEYRGLTIDGESKVLRSYTTGSNVHQNFIGEVILINDEQSVSFGDINNIRWFTYS